jgi:hypothetical protein
MRHLGSPDIARKPAVNSGGNNMKFDKGTGASFSGRMYLTMSALIVALIVALVGAANAQENARYDDGFRVKSATFADNSTLPISMIANYAVSGVNACSSSGAPGGDESPQLSWTHAPSGTRSFVVMGFDDTASFTHWGIYNIGADVTSLPANAGASGSSYGAQIINDFGSAGYEGPCPPPNYTPTSHHYLFTVYALDELLKLPASTDFPAAAETLLHALASAGAHGHVLSSATIGGLYSTAPAT